MAISYPLAWPVEAKVLQIEWSMVNIQSGSRPTYGGAFKTQTWNERLEAVVTLAPMTAADAQAVTGWLLALSGTEGYFAFADPDYSSPKGTATGTPLIDGSGQTGKTITTDGWSTSVTGILKAGDRIQIDNNLYFVTQDANSDGAGAATLEIYPRLRTQPADNASIVTSSPTGYFQMMEPVQGWISDAKKHHTFTFAIQEYIP